MTSSETLLDVRGLTKHFPIRKGLFKRTVGHVKAVDGVDLFIPEGETLGLVGESGCGKTTAGRSILRLLEPTSGTVSFRSRSLARPGEDTHSLDVASATPSELKILRRDLQIIFQDPFSSLNPRMTVASIVEEPLLVHRLGTAPERRKRVQSLLESVGLSHEHLRRYPHEFSGGQRQRIGVARALALEPQLVVCDEPVSALDVSVQAQVINLLESLQREFSLTYLFIAHDLSVVRHISTRVAVMYLGQIAELASTHDLFTDPKHPYTEALMSAVPVPDPGWRVDRILLEGDVPSPVAPPPGCKFHPRCRYARDICAQELPLSRDVGGLHFSSCHFAAELDLQPITTGEADHS